MKVDSFRWARSQRRSLRRMETERRERVKKLASRWRETREQQLAISSSLKKIKRLLEKSGLLFLSLVKPALRRCGAPTFTWYKGVYYLAHQSLGHSLSSLYRAKDNCRHSSPERLSRQYLCSSP